MFPHCEREDQRGNWGHGNWAGGGSWRRFCSREHWPRRGHDPTLQGVQARRQAIQGITIVPMALLGPGRLQQAQHSVQAVAARVFHQRIADAASHGRASVAAAGAIAETTVHVNTVLGTIASSAHSTADPVTQLLIVDAVAALAPQLNAVAGSHISGLRR